MDQKKKNFHRHFATPGLDLYWIIIAYIIVGWFYPVIGLLALICMIGPVMTSIWKGRCWCGPCQALAPMLKRLADEYNGRIKVLKVDVDKNQALAAAARIQSIPTLFFITKEGDIERVVGGLPYQELVRMAEKISSSEE